MFVRTLSCLLLAACALPGAASADALDDALVRIDGAAAGDRAGARVEHAGDVDGDGRPDVVIAAPGVDTAAGEDAGAAYVVFGQASPTHVDLAALGSQGFRIAHATPAGPDEPVAIGVDVAGAGDFNGDGRDDIVVGVRDSADSAFIVFGKASPTPVDLSDLGVGGVLIRNAGLNNVSFISGFTVFGQQVDGAGDVNGDGLADVVLGAPGLAHPDHDETGEQGGAVVVFGRAGTQDVDISSLGTRGFKVFARHAFCCEGSNPGVSVAGLGDVDGDGRRDVALGTSDALYGGIPGEYESISEIDVVYGKASTTPVTVETAGAGVLRIVHGAGPEDRCYCAAFSGDGFGEHLDGIGDVNGDGKADIAVGAPGFGDPHGLESDGATGAAWLVYGRAGSATPVDVLGASRQLRLAGAHGDALGRAFAGGVDLDADGSGRDVAVLGGQFPRFPANDRLHILIQHGPVPTAPQTIDRSELTGGSGTVLDAGPHVYDADLDGVHDTDGDGRDELVLGRAGDDPAGREDAGSAYLLQEPALPCTMSGTARGETLTGTTGDDVICAGAGNDVVDGKGGSDTIYGQRGDDRLTGGPGADTLFGDLGDDRLVGGDGGDALTGGPGVDVLAGGPGDDTGHGGSGRDTLLGGSHDDQLVQEDGGGILNGDGGDDALLTRVPAPPTPDLYAGDQTLLGGDGDDQLSAGTGRDVLNGGVGADSLDGAPGSDRLYGTGGPDTLNGGTGPDLLVGGEGADTLNDDPEYVPPDFVTDVRDTFRCGTAFDRAFGTASDRIAADCEDVTQQ